MLGVRAAVVLGAVIAVAIAAPASGSFSGSNGKVAWVGMDGGLYIDDPWDEQPAGPPVAHVKSSATPPPGTAPVSAPAWSPDGTRLAFTKPIPDTADFPEHSAVFVMDADGGGPRQVSHPFPARKPCDDCDDGEITWDMQPVWTPEGQVAFIRMVAPGEEAPHYDMRGTSIWTVDPDGGGEAMLTHEDPEAAMFQSIVWPQGSGEPYAVVVGPRTGGFQLRAAESDALVATEPLGIIDLDASPDGERLAYTTHTGGGSAVAKVVGTGGAPVQTVALEVTEPPWVRFTPDGNGLLHGGCADDPEGTRHCGWITHRLGDLDGDVRPGDPVKAPYLDGNPAIHGPASGQRSLVDIQGQDLPVLFLPGFLGSEIDCGGSSVWMPFAPPLVLQPIRLAPDGLANATCASAGPTGEPVDSFLGQDVYGHAGDWLEEIDPDGGWGVLGWDWRKRPQSSLLALDDKIDALIASNAIGVQQGASRVALMGHSYGGLLMRAYVADPARARKVARMLTVGSPFWGSPKPVFPFLFGIEAPSSGPLDLMIANEDLKASFRNFGGAYHLLPSDRFGGWLSVGGAARDQAGVQAFLESEGANGALIAEARQTHQTLIDGFFDDRGRIDVRAVVGVGLLTPRAVALFPDAAAGDADVVVGYGDGDETVPAHSATQGPPGTADPLGDDVHIQRRCGVTHMAQTKDEVVQEAYREFLLVGRAPRRLPDPSCPPQGKLVEFFADVPIPPPFGASRFAAAAAAPAGTLTLGQAELAGRADILRLPGRTTVVTNDSRPVSLSLDASGLTMAVTDLEGEARGRRLTYGPMTGTVVLTPGTGDVPQVSVDGQRLAPATDSAGGGPAPDDGGAGAGGGGTTTTTPGSTAAGSPGTTTPAALAASVRGGTVRVSRRGVLTLRVSGDPGSGTLALTAKLGRRTVRLGSAKVRLAKAGLARVKVTLSRSARRTLHRRGRLKADVVLTLRDAAGRTGRATARVTLRD
jgi:hypothetical protein